MSHGRLLGYRGAASSWLPIFILYFFASMEHSGTGEAASTCSRNTEAAPQRLEPERRRMPETREPSELSMASDLDNSMYCGRDDNMFPSGEVVTGHEYFDPRKPKSSFRLQLARRAGKFVWDERKLDYVWKPISQPSASFRSRRNSAAASPSGEVDDPECVDEDQPRVHRRRSTIIYAGASDKNREEPKPQMPSSNPRDSSEGQLSPSEPFAAGDDNLGAVFGRYVSSPELRGPIQ